MGKRTSAAAVKKLVKKGKHTDTPAQAVKRLMKKGKVKKKCCQSKSQCGKCPVLALKLIKAELKKAA